MSIEQNQSNDDFVEKNIKLTKTDIEVLNNNIDYFPYAKIESIQNKQKRPIQQTIPIQQTRININRIINRPLSMKFT